MRLFRMGTRLRLFATTILPACFLALTGMFVIQQQALIPATINIDTIDNNYERRLPAPLVQKEKEVDDDGGGDNNNNNNNNKKHGSRFRFGPHGPDNSFGACLKIQDDNHWLVEWLAYHWFAMPMRHLTILIDDKSKTSPLPIFERWKDYMTIDVVDWDFRGAVPDGMPSIDAVLEHRGPHHLFLENCMRKYKRSGWDSWVMLTDTDEFFSIMPAQETRRSQQVHGNITISPISEPGSIMKHLQEEIRHRKRRNSNATFPDCLTSYRSQICDIDQPPSSSSLSKEFVPVGFQPNDFLTMRWLHRGGERRPKNIVNIGVVEAEYFEQLDLLKNGNIHQVLGGRCTKRPRSRTESMFQVYHYGGTVEQRNFREDVRGKYGRRQGGTKPQKGGCIRHGATDLRPWLHGFVDLVGKEEAQRLLQGAGSVNGWPSFVYSNASSSTQ